MSAEGSLTQKVLEALQARKTLVNSNSYASLGKATFELKEGFACWVRLELKTTYSGEPVIPPNSYLLKEANSVGSYVDALKCRLQFPTPTEKSIWDLIQDDD